MGTSKFGGKYGSICGQIWVPDHDSQFAPLWTEIPLLATVGGCPNTVLSKDLNNPSQSKTNIRNWTKKTSVTGKTHNGQKKCPYGFPGIYSHIWWNNMEYVYDILTEYFMENHFLRLIAMSPNIEIAVNRVYSPCSDTYTRQTTGWFAQPFGTPEIWFIITLAPHTLG